MPGREDSTPDAFRQGVKGRSGVRPGRSEIADPDFFRRLLDIVHFEAAKLVAEVVVLRRRPRGCVISDAELLQARDVVFFLMTAQQRAPKMVEHVWSMTAQRGQQQAGEHPVPQFSGNITLGTQLHE